MKRLVLDFVGSGDRRLLFRRMCKPSTERADSVMGTNGDATMNAAAADGCSTATAVWRRLIMEPNIIVDSFVVVSQSLTRGER